MTDSPQSDGAAPEPPAPAPEFQPLELIGIFWLVMGLIVLLATVFVEGNQYVPLARAVATNLVAGGILLGTGAFCLWRGRRARRRRTARTGKP